jgi:hypothetical protein
MAAAVPAPTAPDPVVEYVARLGAALDGPRRARRDLLLEVAGHLEDATDAYRRAGYEPDEAADRAVADFGTVDEIAPGFRTTLAVSASRRTAAVLLGSLGIQPFLWDGGLDLGAGPHTTAPDTGLYAVLDLGIEVGGALLILGAVAALLATGLGNRWHAAGRTVARVTAWSTLAATALMPATGIVMLALAGAREPALWALVALLLVAPMLGTAYSARRTLAAC